MKWKTKLISTFVAVAALIFGGQLGAGGQSAVQQSEVRETWVDPATGLMWAAKDNGKAVTWGTAVKYCRDLKLGGYSGWRLGTIDELATLVDRRPSTYDPATNTETVHLPMGRHVKGNLGLTGDPWSSDRNENRFGHPYGEGYFFNFLTSKPSFDLQDFRNTKYALCVRGPEGGAAKK